MWSPFRVESVSVLDRSDGSSSPFLVFGWSLRDDVILTGRVVSVLVRSDDSSRTFPRAWCRAFAMGTLVSGRVAYFCTLDRNDGFFFCPSILSCFAMGSPYRSGVVFLPLDRTEVFFGYLVCIPSGWGHPFRV